MHHLGNCVCLFFSLFLITSCSTVEKNIFGETHTPERRTEDTLFQIGEKALSEGNYDLAIHKFEAIHKLYPYSQHSEQSLINLIYAYHKDKQNFSTETTAKRFIRYYPRSKNVDYAYYMLALSHFDLDRGLIFKYLPTDVTERDLEPLKKSFEQFSNFLQRFPNSIYAQDAQLRMIYIRNSIAKKELNTAKFYQKEQRWIACANRLNYLIQHYPESPQVKEALSLLIKAQEHLKLKTLSKQSSGY